MITLRIILVSCTMLFTTHCCMSQSFVNYSPHKYPLISKTVDVKLSYSIKDSLLTNPTTQYFSFVKKPAIYQKIYHKSLGFFCHAENKVAKASSIPIKMRLGTVQYVDKIEGK